MKYHFTSDVHFHHKNIIKFCNRPFASIEEMNEKLIRNWNEVVAPQDIVWQLGDFSFANIEKTESIIKSDTWQINNAIKELRSKYG